MLADWMVGPWPCLEDKLLHIQERGGFSKGGSRRIKCHAQERRNCPRICTRQCMWHSDANAKKAQTFAEDPPSRIPLSWALSLKTCLGNHGFSGKNDLKFVVKGSVYFRASFPDERGSIKCLTLGTTGLKGPTTPVSSLVSELSL